MPQVLDITWFLTISGRSHFLRKTPLLFWIRHAVLTSIPYGCYLGYAIGNKIPVQTFQHFRDTEDWRWRDSDKDYSVIAPNSTGKSKNVNLLINVSGEIDIRYVSNDFPVYTIHADEPGFDFLQSWDQVTSFRKHYRKMFDQIRNDHGEEVIIHLFPATPNPINFEIGKGIMKNIDPTVILYDKSNKSMNYGEVLTLHVSWLTPGYCSKIQQ